MRNRYIYIIGTRVVIALLALCCWQGCASGEAPVDRDDPQPPVVNNGRVAVDLALSVDPSQSAITRQAKAVAQAQDQIATTDFRGIEGIQTADQVVTLFSYIINGNLTDGIFPGFNQKRVTTTYRHYFSNSLTELAIGTARFLGYAKAPTVTVSDTEEPDETKREILRKFRNGSIVPTLSDKAPANIHFDLEPICSNPNDSRYGVGNDMATYLTQIATAGNTTSGYWNALEANAENETFINLFDEFTNYGNAIAGSTANVKEWVKLIKEKVDVLGDSPLKGRILDAIGEIDAHFTGDAYPANLNLPDGSAAMKWYASENKFKAMRGGDVVAPLSDHSRFTYPAELYYFTDSPIKTAESSQESYYADNEWSTILTHYTAGAVVASTTRSVAIEEPLRYGVGCMIATIKAEPTLDDNSALLGEATKHIAINDNDTKFKLTGIMVGGQFQQLYNFTPSTGEDDKEYIIYDKELATSPVYLRTTESSPNYTLVFHSRDNKPVDIVLEFLNNSGEAFAGYEGGIVYPGTKFYLIGSAKPDYNASVTEKANDYNKRVFTHYHKTMLNLNIESLKNAYNVIPNLKTAQYSINVVNVGVKQWDSVGQGTNGLYNW